MKVELDMLRALVLDMVRGGVYGADVTVVDKGAPRQLELLTKSCHLGDTVR